MSSDLRDQLQLAIGNAYRIDRELSSGGVAHVFVAEELSTSRWIVVKTLGREFRTTTLTRCPRRI